MGRCNARRGAPPISYTFFGVTGLTRVNFGSYGVEIDFVWLLEGPRHINSRKKSLVNEAL